MSDESYKSSIYLSKSRRDVTGLIIEETIISLKGQETTKALLKLAKKEEI